MESVRRWGQALGCPDKPQSFSKEKGVRVETYAPCRDKSAMVYVTLEGLGNSWPGGKGSVAEGQSGKRAGRFKANDFIWEFFRQYELNSSQR